MHTLQAPALSYFNPRSSCEERQHNKIDRLHNDNKFQSTLLMRGATIDVIDDMLDDTISIHAPHARSDFVMADIAVEIAISIHAPHARSDPTIAKVLPLPSYFNPRSSCEERLLHTLQAPALSYFNPRSSCEERQHNKIDRLHNDNKFQSTLLMRGATIDVIDDMLDDTISIHAPHARSDFVMADIAVEIAISIHAPHARSDLTDIGNAIRSKNDFNPRSSCEERRNSHVSSAGESYFNPRSSCEERLH